MRETAVRGAVFLAAILTLVFVTSSTSADVGNSNNETKDNGGGSSETGENSHNVLHVTIINDTLRASSTGDALTGSAYVNEIFSRNNVISYRQAYPYSKIQQLLDVYEVRCIKCNSASLKAELERTGKFSEVRRLNSPVALNSGNTGGYDPADGMWGAHAQDWMWNLVITEADLAWNMTLGDPSVLIAVIDNGFDVTHPELTSKMNPIDPSTGNPLPVANHGTSTAAMAAGETAESGTIAEGIMPSVGFNSSVQGFQWGGTTAAHYAALAINADVVSISWFGYCTPDYSKSDHLAIQEIIDSGTTIVAAAANGPMHCSGEDVFPFSALYDERIIVVTSTNEDDMHNNAPGTTHSHYPRVDLAAPGYSVMVAAPGSSWLYYGGGVGTSFAAPFVAGTIGLMKSVNSCLKPSDVQEILKNSTDPIVDAKNFPGEVGTGRVNVNRAVAVSQAIDYVCPQGGSYDTANCHIGTPPTGTNAFIWGDNYYYTALPGNSCPYPGSWYDGANCFVQEVPEGVRPFIWDNKWYYKSCATDGWTAWLDRDNPSGTGDWETLNSFAGVCDEPVAIQCRAKDKTYWTQTTDVGVTCERDSGLACRKVDQVDNTCEDYEVRFFCPSPAVRLRHKLTSKCVYEYGGNGAEAKNWTCWDDPNMAYTVDNIGNGEVRLRHSQTGKCLYGNPKNGGSVHHWGCWNDPNMVYIIDQLGNDEVRLRHKLTGKCLYGNSSNGGSIRNWTCWGDPNMVYYLDKF